MARSHPFGFDPLECRRCLTIVAEVNSGGLFISCDGENTLNHAGDIEGHLFVTSASDGRGPRI